MLSAELELTCLDAGHWRNGWRLLVPPRVLAWPSWALVIVDGSPERVLSVIVTPRGRLANPPPFVDVAAYGKQLGTSAVIVIDRRLLGELSAEIEGALRLDQDGVAQALIALRVLKQHAGKGVWTHPALLDLLPAPSYESVQRTFDLLVPDRSTLLAYVIEDDRSRVHTSIIAEKDGGDIVAVAQHRAIDDLVPEAVLARDWTTSYKRVLGAVEERFAKPAIGVFLERATLLKIITGPSDALARELAAKRVVLDPAPAWLFGLLGGAAAAALAGRALASLLPKATRDFASGLAQRAQNAVSPFTLLGFDPFELWSQLKRHYRP